MYIYIYIYMCVYIYIPTTYRLLVLYNKNQSIFYFHKNILCLSFTYNNYIRL